MNVLLLLIAGVSLWAMLHTYLIYPFLTIRRAEQIISNNGHRSAYLKDDFIERHFLESSGVDRATGDRSESADGVPWPRVSVLMAVHNEAAVIRDKMEALLAQDYPGEWHIYVGSDNSSDATDDILRTYAAREARFSFFPSRQRRGKPGVVASLLGEAPPLGRDHLLLLTDASVIPRPEVMRRLAAPFRRYADLALADARMIHVGMRAGGIGRTEDVYISGEVRLKQAEGLLWGYTMGPFGGCFALRSDYYHSVPRNFLVDDFFLCLSAYAAGGRGISIPDAPCYEAVGQRISEEFSRKVRISAGNWQNLLRFRRQWWPPTGRLAYAFFSHKILRWLTPFLLILSLASLSLFAVQSGNYWARAVVLFLITALTIPPIVDYCLEKWFALHWLPLRGMRYFLAMNVALLVGFFRYLKGISSNVWQPSKRH